LDDVWSVRDIAEAEGDTSEAESGTMEAAIDGVCDADMKDRIDAAAVLVNGK
jgi:hypothetical protein